MTSPKTFATGSAPSCTCTAEETPTITPVAEIGQYRCSQRNARCEQQCRCQCEIGCHGGNLRPGSE
ncbi:hypothetical protein CCMA1212_000619 [Trichoderma ghanense]|uniref:Metallothionein n=1 Tax=Trichoderma ghanense TaxID=65468 RepID=A0ABY2HKI3_9HYPO